ncbi:MAG: FAD binding domain-containing protein [Candidatus Hydrogenedentes bacterium]|nr:FAD binding domain-containing protein [Candidatus Hydrogenedentota bacterium]
MNAFEYAMPKSVDEAISLLSDKPGESQVMAGGTDLVTALKQGIVTPKRVVSLRHIDELNSIQTADGQLRIGAMTALDDIAANETVQKSFPAIISAIKGIGSQQITSIGTIGGDLCQLPRDWYFRSGFGLVAQLDGKDLIADGDNRYHAIFGNDGPAKFVNASILAPALIALGAKATVRGASGATRDIALEELFHAPQKSEEGNTTLAANEIVTSIVIPVGAKKNALYFVKPRHGLDWPLVAAAVAYDVEGGNAKNVRIVLGHVAPTPWLSESAAKALEGAVLNEETAAKAGNASAEGASPLSRNAYKVQLTKVAVKRAILATIA